MSLNVFSPLSGVTLSLLEAQKRVLSGMRPTGQLHLPLSWCPEKLAEAPARIRMYVFRRGLACTDNPL